MVIDTRLNHTVYCVYCGKDQIRTMPIERLTCCDGEITFKKVSIPWGHEYRAMSPHIETFFDLRDVKKYVRSLGVGIKKLIILDLSRPQKEKTEGVFNLK